MTTQAWSTDAIPARDRFAVWREWRAAHIFGVTAELDRAARETFQASISSRAIGTATLVDIRASAYRARRTWQDIDRVRSDSLCIYHQTTGPDWVFHDGSERFVVPRSSIALGYSDLPYETVPITSDVFQTRLVKIPLPPPTGPQDRRKDMRPRVLQPKRGLDALLHAYAISFFQQIEALDESNAEAAVEVLGRLALLAQANAPPPVETEGATEAVSAAHLRLAQDFIAQNLQRSHLSPAAVARALGLSLRQLHRLFEPTGTSFARYVLNARIDRVAQLLACPTNDSVIETAFACGFTGSSVFYRAFRKRYGMSPTDYRDTLRAGIRGEPRIFSSSGTQRETAGTQWDAKAGAIP